MKLISSILITLLFALSFTQPVIAKNASVKPGVVQMTSVNLNKAGAKEIHLVHRLHRPAVDHRSRSPRATARVDSQRGRAPHVAQE